MDPSALLELPPEWSPEGGELALGVLGEGSPELIPESRLYLAGKQKTPREYICKFVTAENFD